MMDLDSEKLNELRPLLIEVGKEGAKEVLLAIGLDANTPEGVLRSQKIIAHAGWWSDATATGQLIIARTVMTMAAAAVIGAVWLGFKQQILRLIGKG